MKMMKRITAWILVMMMVMAMSAVPAFAEEASVEYRTHVKNLGWLDWQEDGEISGTQGENRRVEALQLRISGVGGGVEYEVHVKNYGWMAPVSNGSIAGTVGEGRRVECVRIRLTGEAAAKYSIIYRVHVQDTGTMSWRANGQEAGTTGEGRQIESIEIKLVPKGDEVKYTSAWQWPMSNFRVTQDFNHYSSSMAQKKGRPYHTGIDMVSSDTGIVAAADGVVEFAGFTSSNGHHIVLSHTLNGQTVFSLYSHLSSMAVSKGQTVSKGSYLGEMGNTGNSTGAHLHFGIFSGSLSTDPVGYASGSGTNKISHGGRTFYNPSYVISNGRLP